MIDIIKVLYIINDINLTESEVFHYEKKQNEYTNRISCEDLGCMSTLTVSMESFLPQ